MCDLECPVGYTSVSSCEIDTWRKSALNKRDQPPKDLGSITLGSGTKLNVTVMPTTDERGDQRLDVVDSTIKLSKSDLSITIKLCAERVHSKLKVIAESEDACVLAEELGVTNMHHWEHDAYRTEYSFRNGFFESDVDNPDFQVCLPEALVDVMRAVKTRSEAESTDVQQNP